MFGRFYQEKDKFIELEDGYTLALNTSINEHVGMICWWLNPAAKAALLTNASTTTKAITSAAKHCAKYTDLDTLFNLCIKEYKLQQKKNEESLLKNYQSMMDTNFG